MSRNAQLVISFSQ